MRTPQSFLEGLIFLLLLIPIAGYYLVKWIIKGIIFLVIAVKSPTE